MLLVWELASQGKAAYVALVPFSQVGKTYELLNCDKHKSMLLKNGRDPGEVRPDIAHQVTPGAELRPWGLWTEGKAAVGLLFHPDCALVSTPPPSEFTDADGQSSEPGGLAPGLHPHAEECAD